MITQTVDPQNIIQRAKQIKAQLPILLSQWGLLSSFKRWRLARDPGTGMVILFGVLNNDYIATHTTTPPGNYFDQRLLSDMEKELHVQVITSSEDGLRYAFVLEKGSLNDNVESNDLQDGSPRPQINASGWQIEKRISLISPNGSVLLTDHVIMHQKLDRFLRDHEILKEAANTSQNPQRPVSQVKESEFNIKKADYETNQNRTKIPPDGYSE
jgi:hypothetical protein